MNLIYKADGTFRHSLFLIPVAIGLMTISGIAPAATVGDMATQITGSFKSLAELITATSYLGGLGFSIGAIMKFKQHKDNPTQIPIGTPVAMLFIASALLFLPSILGMAGDTMFGGDAETAGPTGQIFEV
jgi:intracellular multiplication protein IcmD